MPTQMWHITQCPLNVDASLYMQLPALRILLYYWLCIHNVTVNAVGTPIESVATSGCKSLLLVTCCWQSGSEHFSRNKRQAVLTVAKMQLSSFALVALALCIGLSVGQPCLCTLPTVDKQWHQWPLNLQKLITESAILIYSNTKLLLFYTVGIEHCMSSSLYMWSTKIVS